MKFASSIIVLGLLLAGCLADSSDDQNGGDLFEDEAIVLPWGLKDCLMAVAVLPATTAAVAPHLPEGFRSLSMEEIAGTATDLVGEANFGVEVLSCASGTTLNGTQDRLVYGSYFTAVEPPAELAENVTIHFVKWETLIPDEGRREVLASYGIPAVDGSGSFDLHEGQGTTWVYQAAMTLDGASFSFIGTSMQAAEGPFTFVEFQETERGLVRWHASVDLSQVAIGPVTVALPDAGRAADIVNQPVAVGAAYAGVVSFNEASITIPESA